MEVSTVPSIAVCFAACAIHVLYKFWARSQPSWFWEVLSWSS